MINLDFMPSRQLALYAARLFLTRSLAVLVMLVLVLMTLDLLGESGKILNVPGNGEAELWRYVSLRVPILISRFLPFSVLLGALIAFVGLNQHSEVISMKASGLSAHQILAPMIVASLGVAIALFAFNELVVVKSARTVNAWTDADYEPIPPSSGILSNVWIRDGDDMVRARIVSGNGPTTRLRGVTIYERERGALARVIEADRAEQVPGGWRLENVRTYDALMNIGCANLTMIGLSGVEPARFTLAKVDPGERDLHCPAEGDPGPARCRPTDRGSANRLVAQDQRAFIDGADAAAGGNRGFRPCPIGSGAAARDDRNGAGLHLFRGRQFQPGARQLRRLPAVPCRLGAVPAVPSDRRIRPDPAGRIATFGLPVGQESMAMLPGDTLPAADGQSHDQR